MKYTSARRCGAISASLLLALYLILGSLPWVAAQDAPAAAFTVNSANDVNDGACNATHCSLREAINAANCLGSPLDIFDLTAVAAQWNTPCPVVAR
jgi:CSLREA domain-containing protein